MDRRPLDLRRAPHAAQIGQIRTALLSILRVILPLKRLIETDALAEWEKDQIFARVHSTLHESVNQIGDVLVAIRGPARVDAQVQAGDGVLPPWITDAWALTPTKARPPTPAGPRPPPLRTPAKWPTFPPGRYLAPAAERAVHGATGRPHLAPPSRSRSPRR